jgi:hypothetical protein
MNHHAVQFYDHEAFLLEHLGSFVKEGLLQEDTVLVVATATHRAELRAQLISDHVFEEAPGKGVYVAMDATDTLALFMINDWPDEKLFMNVIGDTISSLAHGTPVRIYGEMVAVLWSQGQFRAAIRLEQLWNQLGSCKEFSLLCGYPIAAFQDGSLLDEVSACHSHIIESTYSFRR